MNLPILYSLQNCPYAMRARLAILLAQQTVLLRAVTTKNKPAEMLAASAKGTIPVLVFNSAIDFNSELSNSAISERKALAGSGEVIDESLAIMLWALTQNDPDNLLYAEQADALPEMLKIIEENDKNFKPTLENYKRAKRFREDSEEYCRLQCEHFIQQLEIRLANHDFLMGPTPSLLDYALLPFIRQFARVNRQLYLRGPYKNLQVWLSYHLQSQLFSKAMLKYPLWLECHEEFILGG